MKKLPILTLFVLITCCTFAQITDFNKIVPDENTRPKTFEDYLVQLAWNNSPQSKILGSEEVIAELDVDLTKRDWMKNLQAQWNVNEISLSNIIYPENELFVALPIWNVTATVDLNMVLNRKKRIQVSKQKHEITKQSTNILKMQLRAQVIQRYLDYLLSIELLKVSTEAEQDASENNTLLLELFKKDKAKYEDVSRAALAYTNSKKARIIAEMDIKLAKVSLEELIGIKYEEAERFGKSYKKEN